MLCVLFCLNCVTLDETIALGTAAVEITRDAEGAGNALKTISMRIRGYDEETKSDAVDLATDGIRAFKEETGSFGSVLGGTALTSLVALIKNFD